MRNPGAGPASDPFPTKMGGAGEAAAGVNQEATVPYFLLQPGIPRLLMWWQDQQALPAEAAATPSSHILSTLRLHPVAPLTAVPFIPLGGGGKLRHREFVRLVQEHPAAKWRSTDLGPCPCSLPGSPAFWFSLGNASGMTIERWTRSGSEGES